MKKEALLNAIHLLQSMFEVNGALKWPHEGMAVDIMISLCKQIFFRSKYPKKLLI